MLSNLNSNYKDIRAKQQIILLKQKSLKQTSFLNNEKKVGLHEPNVTKDDEVLKMHEIYEKDEKAELADLLKELSVNRNIKKNKK
jgi:hypothetical protein